MVRLTVIQNDIMDLSRIAYLPNIIQILIKEGQMAGFNQRCFFSAFYDIRIVTGTILGFHHHVENAHGGVENPNCMDVFGDTAGRQWKNLLRVITGNLPV